MPFGGRASAMSSALLVICCSHQVSNVALVVGAHVCQRHGEVGRIASHNVSASFFSLSRIHIIVLLLVILHFRRHCHLLLQQVLAIQRTGGVQLQPRRNALQIKQMITMTRQPDHQRMRVLQEWVRANRTRHFFLSLLVECEQLLLIHPVELCKKLV